VAKTLPYEEGDVFGVPLEGDGWGLGLVARAAANGFVVLGYFFGPRRDDLPSAEDLPTLKREDAALVDMFGDRGLVEGSWPVIGPLEGWRREDWPFPAFRWTDAVSGTVMRVCYDDHDPSQQVSRERVDPAEAEGLPPDGLAGAELVCTRLSRRLA
jgi:hypothetical protein